MTLKQFTTVSGKKIIVNMEQVEYIDNDCADGHIRLNIMGDALICVKCTLKSIMRWYQKQNQAKKAEIKAPNEAEVLIWQPTKTYNVLDVNLDANDDLVHNKDNQTPDFSKSDFYYKEGQLPNS